MTEAPLMRAIMLALSADGHYVARTNVGTFWTKDGRPVKIGVPGESDLHGYRASDCRAFFLEIKRPGGARRPEQLQFIAAMQKRGAIAAFVTSIDEAKQALRENP